MVTPGDLILSLDDEQHLVELKLPGYESWSGWMRFAEPRMRVLAALIPREKKQSKLLEPPETKQKELETKNLPAKDAFLSLRTEGTWAEVYFRDKKIGVTPLKKVALPAGKIELKLVNPVTGMKEQVVLELEAGQHTLHSEKLR